MSNLKHAYDLFINHLKEEGKSNSTILAYGKDIEQLIELLEKINLKEVTEIEKEHIDLFLEKINKEGYTPKSVSRKLNSIRTFGKVLVQKGLIKENPAITIAHPKIKKQTPRVLTELEFRALRDACRNDNRLYTIVEIMLQTGIRIGELARLKLADLELDSTSPQIYIREYSSNKARYIPLNDNAASCLKGYLKERGDSGSDSVFITKTGRGLLVRNIRTSINRAFKNAGIENAKVNDLRNTFIAHNLAKGANLVSISQIVGHKRISTTEKYLDLVKKEGENKTKLQNL